MLVFDGIIGSGFVETARSESFETVRGIVTRCELKRARKGGVSIDLEYEYTVNGQLFTGTKYHVGPQFVGNKYWEAAHGSLPVGAQVMVYYDPDEARTACLVPGFRTDSLFLLWILTPFNLVMLGFLYEAIWYVMGRRAFDPALSRCVWLSRDGYSARPHPDTQFVAKAFVILLGITFAGSFLAGGYILAFDFPPPLWIPLAMWGLALGATVVFGERASWHALIHINELEGTIAFPVDWKRVIVIRSRVIGVEQTTEKRSKKELGEFEIFVVALRWRNDDDHEELTKLAEYDERADAEALANWLCEHLGLTAVPTLSASR
jgi:hypothetical protein